MASMTTQKSFLGNARAMAASKVRCIRDVLDWDYA